MHSPLQRDNRDIREFAANETARVSHRGGARKLGKVAIRKNSLAANMLR